MIKTLLGKQLRELTAFLYQSGKTGKRRGVAAMIGYGVLLVYAFGAFGFLIYQMADTLCAPLVGMGLGWLYFALIGLLATFLGVVGSVFSVYSTLYQAKDNELLLSMPIPPGVIMLTRLVGVYLLSVLFELVVLIPAGLKYLLVGPVTAMSVVLYILTCLILPLLSVVLACLLGWVLALIASRVKNGSFFRLEEPDGFYRLYGENGEFLALARITGGTCRTINSFFEV